MTYLKLKGILFALLFSFSAQAQHPDTLAVHHHLDTLQFLADSVLQGKSDSVRKTSNAMMIGLMDTLLHNPATWSYSFSTLKNLSVLTSEDKKFRIYTWMMPLNRGMEFHYFGYVQTNEKGKLKIYKLKEVKYSGNDEAEYARLTDSTWYGALYYKIVEKKVKKKSQYILLGWHGKDAYSTRKIMETIAVHPSRIEFGKPVFKTGAKAKSRIILEYNARANVSLNYNDDLKMIVHDHLSSSDPRPESRGMYQLYGPDMTYTGYKFKDGFWFLQKDVEVQNKYDTDAKDVKLHRDLRMQRKNE